MRIKKSCVGCRASSIIVTSFSVRYTCSLHYQQFNQKPQEVCPKPLTIKAFITEHNNNKKH